MFPPGRSQGPTEGRRIRGCLGGSGTPTILGYLRPPGREALGRIRQRVPRRIWKPLTAIDAAVEAADEAFFVKEVTSAGGAKGPLANVIDFVAVQHVLVHLRDIRAEEMRRLSL